MRQLTERETKPRPTRQAAMAAVDDYRDCVAQFTANPTEGTMQEKRFARKNLLAMIEALTQEDES